MDETVTGVFANQRLAHEAARGLMTAGIRADQIRVLDGDDSDADPFRAWRSASAKSSALLGMVLWAVGAACVGAAVGSVYGCFRAIVFSQLSAAAGCAIIGLQVGRASAALGGPAIDRPAGGGAVLVCVTGDSAQQAQLMDLLVEHGSSSLVTKVTDPPGAPAPAKPG